MGTTRTGRQDCTMSVAEAVREAMQTPTSRPSSSAAVETPQDLPAPMPHLPLRKALAERLQAKRATPKPVWTTPAAHEVRGFNPTPVQPLPHMDNITASSEHAFAGKEDSKKIPFKPPLGVQMLKQEEGVYTQSNEVAASSQQMDGSMSRPPSSPIVPTPPDSPHKAKGKTLKSSRSVGEGLRGFRNRFSSPNEARHHEQVTGEIRASVPMVPSIPADEVRDSFRSAVTSSRSAVTSNSSCLHTSSIHTELSSLTAHSSHTSDFVHVYPDWPATTPDVVTDDEMTVEDAIGMYVDGFDSSARPSLDTEVRKSSVPRRSCQENKVLLEARPSSQRSEERSKLARPQLGHRRSQSASLLDRVQKSSEDDGFVPKRLNRQHTFSRILSAPAERNGSIVGALEHATVPRDRYGFKKASLHVTVEQYDAWNLSYTDHLERRTRKWYTLMQSYGFSTEQPFRFPPKGDKIKRYVRKGIPPEFRGAAWFWYAGGPSKLVKEPGLYYDMLERVKEGKLSDNDKEHIERDLHRTFPDNVRFKPDPSTMTDAQARAGGGGGDEILKKKGRHSTDPETPMLQSLRRVLQAFAVHSPQIGYCQSLNFIAGLLLLFLDQDEEKTFILLNIVTTVHLPGTHGVALEGANIDIAVLMSCIKDSLPAIWAKLDDNGGTAHLAASTLFPKGAEALRLPTVSLATTAWFMSLFVGTLPIESVLRIWDCLFFEGSKTLFRIALAIFKFGEKEILGVSDSMEIFQVVQTIPRGMLDINALMEVCFRRRGGFGHVSQGLIEGRREERRKEVRAGVASIREGQEGRGIAVWRGRWRGRVKG